MYNKVVAGEVVPNKFQGFFNTANRSTDENEVWVPFFQEYRRAVDTYLDKRASRGEIFDRSAEIQKFWENPVKPRSYFILGEPNTQKMLPEGRG